MSSKPIGPGPGAYQLPTTVGFPAHDPSRYRNPMYSFGANVRFGVKPLGPGPSYRIDRVTRDGNMTSPCWSFGARLPYRRLQCMPGPGAHAPERCPPFKTPRAPAYVMGARLDRCIRRPGPAPNAYMVRSGPAGPAYSMGSRLERCVKAGSPGPAVYFQRDLDVNMHRTPRYSLGARIIRDKVPRTPGPAAYPPDLYDTKKRPYCYSFGTQHSPWAPPMIIAADTMDCL